MPGTSSMHGDPMPGGQVANGVRLQAGDGEPAIAFRADDRPTAVSRPASSAALGDWTSTSCPVLDTNRPWRCPRAACRAR